MPPDSDLSSDLDQPPDLRALLTARFVGAVVVSSLVAVALVVGWAPATAWPAWVGLATVGVLLGWIDAATTWLPLRLTQLLWAVTAVGVVGTAALSARAPDPTGWWLRPLWAVGGAAVLGLFFALMWLLARGGLGFGDVRLAVGIGAATGACSPTTVLVAALVGSALGALWAVGRAVRGRREPFPYGPFLLVGAFLAPLLTA